FLALLVAPHLLEAGKLGLGPQHVRLAREPDRVARPRQLLDVGRGPALVLDEGEVLAGEQELGVGEAPVVHEGEPAARDRRLRAGRFGRLHAFGQPALPPAGQGLAEAEEDTRVVVRTGAETAAAVAVADPDRGVRQGRGLWHARALGGEALLRGPQLGAARD